MNRNFLRLFFVAVQFVMLAVSIPKVATLFHAYEGQAMGMAVWGLDIRSWGVGIAIDLTATFTTWAAMAKYEESRKRSTLLAPAIIIFVCTFLSVIANYEDAATIAPHQYAGILLFSQPALVVNPLLISSPPILVLLLILLVPSVLSRPRIKSIAEIEAEAEEAEAMIMAQGRIREAKARANAAVRGVQLKGLVSATSAVLGTNNPEPLPEPPDDPDPEPPSLPPAQDTHPIPAIPTAKMTRTLWNAMPIKDRVTQSGVITPQEVADVLGISRSHARNLINEAGDKQTVQGRSGVPYHELIQSLYDRHAKDSFDWARKLETTLGIRKRSRQHLQVVENQDVEAENDA